MFQRACDSEHGECASMYLFVSCTCLYRVWCKLVLILSLFYIRWGLPGSTEVHRSLPRSAKVHHTLSKSAWVHEVLLGPFRFAWVCWGQSRSFKIRQGPLMSSRVWVCIGLQNLPRSAKLQLLRFFNSLKHDYSIISALLQKNTTLFVFSKLFRI